MLEHTELYPEQPITAEGYWDNVTRQLVIGPDTPNQYRKQSRVTFPLRHGIIRNKKIHYMKNIRPLNWRAARVLKPPKLMVNSKTGLGCVRRRNQNAPLPHYFRGVSHQLFPKLKSGFVSMKASTRGEIVGNRKPYTISNDVRPRL